MKQLERHIFTAGNRYKAKLTFVSFLSTFNAGEVLVYKRYYLSPYDNCCVYEFITENDGQDKLWWLHMDEVTESWHQFFEALTPSLHEKN